MSEHRNKNADWLRRAVARDVCTKEYPYEDVLDVLREAEWFDNWDDDEIHVRPVDLESLSEHVFGMLDCRKKKGE